jgi:hypothetical protein
MTSSKVKFPMDKDIYIDPPDKNSREIYRELVHISETFAKDNEKRFFHLQQFMEKIFPGWLIDSIDEYSEDYRFFQTNWINVSLSAGTTPKKIVLVDAIFFDKDHLILNIFCERMAREGFLIRRKEEIVKCKKCSKGLLSENVYKYVKKNGKAVQHIPQIWSDKCSTC